MRSPAEIRFRLRQELANVFLRFFPPSPHVPDLTSPLPGLPDPATVASAIKGSSWAAELTAIAEKILSGHLPILGICIETGPEPAWRRDYLSGKETPPIFFRRIPYLDASKAGDHKNIWELSRHQHLVLVAQAFALTRDPRYSRFVVAQIRHWWRENPFQRGINWASSLEVAFRTLSWIWIFHLLAAEVDPPFRKELIVQLYRHGLHLEYNLSIYFSPNTHLLGEALALHALGRLFPQFERSARWRASGRAILISELDKQVQADGSYFEQSTYYHVYALDMFLFHHTLEPLPDTKRLESMAEFLAAVVGPDGALPFLGDDDGGRLFHPFGPRRNFARATLATASVLLCREYFCYSDRDLLEQALWWVGTTALGIKATTPESSAPYVDAFRYFPQAGLVSMKSAGIHVLFDAGPFGPGGAGHSHSDTLSLVVTAGETEILIDPGSFTYVADPVWREHFRGSAAHNTLRVNGRDQAEPAGPFRWTGKPEAKVLSSHTDATFDSVEAVCSYAGIRHRRKLSFDKPARLLTITDTIESDRPECLVEQFWHAGGAVTEIGAGQWSIADRAALMVDSRAACELLDDWRSDAPASKRPAVVIRAWLCAPSPIQLRTTLQIG